MLAVIVGVILIAKPTNGGFAPFRLLVIGDNEKGG